MNDKIKTQAQVGVPYTELLPPHEQRVDEET
jgi:hypothetical protein